MLKYKERDIVLIKSLNIEGMIMNVGFDLNTKEAKYCITCGEDRYYYATDEDLIKTGTLEELLEKFEEEFEKSHTGEA